VSGESFFVHPISIAKTRFSYYQEEDRLSQTILLIITAVGSVGTLIGAIFVVITLRADHDWRRRQYAAELLNHWNDITADHSKAIEETFPHLRDVDKTTNQVNELTREISKKICACRPDEKEYWNVKFHIFELLNHLECVVSAYNHQVADSIMINTCLKEPILVWMKIFKNFLDVVAECEGFQPWQQLIEQSNEWKRTPGKKRKSTS
jgi:hypothetical protein